MSLQKLYFISTLLLFTSFQSSAQIDTAGISGKLKLSAKQLGKDVICLIQKDGKTIYKKENPEFNLKTQLKAGAISQWLTAALVMTYVQEGKLSLDDKVSKYLPFFKQYSKGHITIRHCLTHQTGIEADPKAFTKNRFKTLEDEAMGIASRKEIETNPGTEYKYSQIGYSLAGRVLEVITKKGFDRLIQDRVLRPLNMRGTSFTNEDFNQAPSPFSGARTTANDLTNFMVMLLSKGKFNNKQILSEESVKLLVSMQIPPAQLKSAPKEVDGMAYTFGAWVVESDTQEKPKAIGTTSLTGSWAMVDICKGYTMVVLTRELSSPPAKDLYLDLKSIVDAGIAGKCE